MGPVGFSDRIIIKYFISFHGAKYSPRPTYKLVHMPTVSDLFISRNSCFSIKYDKAKQTRQFLKDNYRGEGILEENARPKVIIFCNSRPLN